LKILWEMFLKNPGEPGETGEPGEPGEPGEAVESLEVLGDPLGIAQRDM
jgi:hypothetical protein